jgi:hypothetical protein
MLWLAGCSGSMQTPESRGSDPLGRVGLVGPVCLLTAISWIDLLSQAPQDHI